MRKLEDVTDDEIVDAVAACGLAGSGDLSEQTKETRLALLLGCELPYAPEQYMLMDRLLALAQGNGPRLVDHPTKLRFYVSPEEWGRRLEGKSAAEIAAALKGSAS